MGWSRAHEALFVSLAGVACRRLRAARRAQCMQGYGEADYIYVASQESGVIAEIVRARGRRGGSRRASFPSWRASRIDFPLRGRLGAARARWRKRWKQRAPAPRSRAAITSARSGLFGEGFVARARLDADRAALDAANAQTGGGAPTNVRLQRRDRTLAGAALRSCRRGAARPARSSAFIHRPGEVVAAGQPIAALLAPENMKVRFFAPQAMLAQLAARRARRGVLRRLRRRPCRRA